MNENLDSTNPQLVKRTQQVTGRLSVKPVDDVSFTEHNKRLQKDRGHKDRSENPERERLVRKKESSERQVMDRKVRETGERERDKSERQTHHEERSQRQVRKG